ncbi:MAG: peptidase C15 [Cyanosarcina radialis HA8281-LM2]|jgi:pyroglutamyl-peptidase|nr:peptidase C15 [Cyanosarcina radialis HA8281-LM2]
MSRLNLPAKILLTSFDTWLPHHTSNASDDLLEELTKIDHYLSDLTFLRKLPVEVVAASQRAIAKINQVQPQAIVCCGMAEKRQKLTVESRAIRGNSTLKTRVDLEELIAGLAITNISHNAGKFVCEGLYYEVLAHLQKSRFNSHCIFVHVPRLTESNLPEVLADFLAIVQRIAVLSRVI